MKLTENQCKCISCGSIKTYSEKVRQRQREMPCRTCAGKKRTLAKNRFKRVCELCGDTKTSNVAIKAKICRNSSRKPVMGDINFDRDHNYIKVHYTYFCPECPSVRVLVGKRKSAHCKECARIHTKRKRREGSLSFNFDTMSFPERKHMPKLVHRLPLPKVRHVRICTECEESKIVSSVAATINKKCKACSLLAKPKKYVKKSKAKAEKNPSAQAIDKARKANKAHHEYIEKEKKKVPKKQKLTDEEMMAEWMKTNEVKKAGIEIEMPHIEQVMYIKADY